MGVCEDWPGLGTSRSVPHLILLVVVIDLDWKEARWILYWEVLSLQSLTLW